MVFPFTTSSQQNFTKLNYSIFYIATKILLFELYKIYIYNFVKIGTKMNSRKPFSMENKMEIIYFLLGKT